MGPIGVFDSGYGGLTILRQLTNQLAGYDYIYLGDNARAPYGSRSYWVVYQYTLQAVNYLFERGCHLVILACNTASAKALRTIQQNDLPHIDPNRRVLGVIRPSAEAIGSYTKSGVVGVLGTQGTVISESYPLEIAKLYPEIKVYQQACPLWVPLIENGETGNPGANYFIQKDLELLLKQNPDMDAVILGCTHYPLIYDTIRRFLPAHIRLISQDTLVAASLQDYLMRHPEMDARCSKQGMISFYTTDVADVFASQGSLFLSKEFSAEQITL